MRDDNENKDSIASSFAKVKLWRVPDDNGNDGSISLSE
jgi:hypothetical protein